MPFTSSNNLHRTGSLYVDWTQDIDDVRELWKDFQKAALGGPHDTLEWCEAWSQTAGRKNEPLIVTGRDDSGKVLFLLPLTIRQRYGTRVLEWLGNEQGNYASGLFHPSAWHETDLARGDALLESILHEIPAVDAVHLADQPDTFVRGTNPLAGLAGVAAASSGYILPLQSDWEAHFKERFSSRQRSRLRSFERQLNKHGAVSFEDVRDPFRRLKIVDHMIAEKREWFADKGIPDFLGQDGMRDFFRMLAQASEDGSGPFLRIFTLRAGNEIAATSVGLVFQNRFYGLLSSTTSGPLRRFGPGRVIFLKIVETLAGEELEMIDCGAGEDDDKLKWCTAQRQRRHAIVPVTLKGRAYCAALMLALVAKRHIKQSPAIWSWAQRARQWKTVMRKPSVAIGTGATAAAIASLLLIEVYQDFLQGFFLRP